MPGTFAFHNQMVCPGTKPQQRSRKFSPWRGAGGAGQGLGRALLQVAIIRAQESEPETMFLEVGAETHMPWPLYAGLGLPRRDAQGLL